MLERIEAVPGVRAVALSRHPLLSLSRRSSSVSVEDARPTESGAFVNIVSPEFFRTLEIPHLLGRPLDERDAAGATATAVVNERFAAAFFGGASPIGRRLWFASKAGGPGAVEIVGLVRDAKYTDVRSRTPPTVYIPFRQEVPGQAAFAVRTDGDPDRYVTSVRQAVRDVDPTLPVFDVKAQVEQAEESISRETLFARLSSIFGGVTLLLAVVGLYGSLAYAVAQRRTELGVRMALGATRGSVVQLVLREALIVASAGLAAGLAFALAAGRAARSTLDPILFGLTPHDPVVLSAAVALLLVVAVLAALVPARTAAHVDPVVALRGD
jgi:predicted permease